jgi:hypothetical protein
VHPDPSFFGLQRRFADRWAELAGCSRDEAYLECTTWYHQVCGLGRDFDPEHPEWRRFLRVRAEAEDADALVATRAAAGGADAPPSASAFDYAWDGDAATVRLHFQSHGVRHRSALARDEIPRRREELRVVIVRARREHPEAAWVRGRSWLYNLEAYRRLFPPSFIAGLVPDEHDLQFLATWGQFLTRQGDTRPAMADAFRSRVDSSSNTAELEEAFPFGILETRAAIEDFVAFYGAG